MKAISLHQPWASLCVTRQPCGAPTVHVLRHCPPHPMVKRFETRSWPCPPNLIGSRIALHATKREPTDREIIGVWEMCDTINDPRWEMCPSGVSGTGHGTHVPLPLGAVVGSAVIEACYPIFTYQGEGWAEFVMSHDDEDHAYIGNDLDNELIPDGAHGLFIRRHKIESPTSTVGWSTDITDQSPYGDFTPGRYAWLLTDAAPTTERCPWCWGRKFLPCSPLGSPVCPVCDGAGRCEPIPARGRQRIWNWQPSEDAT